MKTTIAVVLMAAGAAAVYSPLRAYWQARNRPNYRQANVTRGPIVAVATASALSNRAP